ncbi:hypothetical protein N7456_013512 [Penicillium angulare]|uniref:Uncharacterized protein n=1 Tax=Penicillium angulare TaxID=116970 RepID=A0A9W9EF71_9EURO|nr:hypothetical protein N7456_013512 [Penicillium angulare]
MVLNMTKRAHRSLLSILKWLLEAQELQSQSSLDEFGRMGMKTWAGEKEEKSAGNEQDYVCPSVGSESLYGVSPTFGGRT